MAASVLQQVSSLVGANYVSTDPDVLAGRSADHTGRYRGHASALVRPGSAGQGAGVVRRPSRVRADTTGYDLPALFVGAEGTLGVITALDLRLHPDPSHRVTAVCGFGDPAALVDAGRVFRHVGGIWASV